MELHHVSEKKQAKLFFFRTSRQIFADFNNFWQNDGQYDKIR